MTLSSPKGLPGYLGLPRPLSSLLISIVGLALFLAVASRILISYPISSTIHEYIAGLDNSRSVFFSSSGIEFQQSDTANESATDFEQSGNLTPIFPYFIRGKEADTTIKHSFQNATDKSNMPLPSFSGGIHDVKSVKGSITRNDIKSKHVDGAYSIGSASNSNVLSSNTSQDVSESLNGTNMVMPPAQFLSGLSEKHDSGSCNLYHGRWVYDTAGPLYTNNTCPAITQMQNCQGNGRPDSDYENWRWKPDQCDLPRFDAKKFLQLMRGKTLAFVGDSVARNQMESLLCILWQAETPKNRGNRRMQRWFFRSTSTMIIRIWSSWLVHRTSAPVQFAPEGIDKLHLDAPDETLMEHLPMFDVLVLSSGHWFAKQSVYVLNGTVVGGQLWWPSKFQEMTVNNVEAFGISVETALTAIAGHPNYTGLTIVRSFSPDHYEGGAWNTGGSCTGKVEPAMEVVRNGFTDAMHEKQVQGFEKAALKAHSRSKLRLLDITEAFGYRHDGHPGPYRSPDPNKVTKRGPGGKPPPQDCLHWCMPGPVDTWNELVLEIIRREFEKAPGA